MTTLFPAALDDFADPAGTDLQSSGLRTHSEKHTDLNDAVEAIEAAIGAGVVARNVKQRLADNEQYNHRDSRLKIFAHRGFANQAPQNTTLAFSAAVRRGAYGLECDVQPSSDGVLYCFHDANLGGITSGTGTFTSVTSAYIDGLTFLETAGTPFATLRISKFSEVLAIAMEAGVEILVEIKAYRTTADIALLVNAVIDAGAEDIVTINSSTIEDLAYVRAVSPTIAVAAVNSLTANYQASIDLLASYGRGSIIWLASALLSTPGIISYAKSKGVGVIAFTVDDQQTMRQLMRAGVRRVISNVSLKGS